MNRILIGLTALTSAVLIFSSSAVASNSVTATATPGQNGTEAIVPYAVVLTTIGDFEPQGPQSQVELIASETANTPSAEMTPERWEKKVIVAWLPQNSPSPGTADFSVKVTTRDGTTYRAWPVKVTSIGGEGGYPPTHDPTSGAVLAAPTPVNA